MYLVMDMNFDGPGGRSLTDPLSDIALTLGAPKVRRGGKLLEKYLY